MTTPLAILPGAAKGFFTIGYVVEGMELRDTRHSPWLKMYEAVWLLHNAQRDVEVESRLRNSTHNRGRVQA